MAKYNNNGDEICNHNFQGGLCRECLAPQTAGDQGRAERALYKAEELEGRYIDTFGKKTAKEQSIIDAHRICARQ